MNHKNKDKGCGGCSKIGKGYCPAEKKSPAEDVKEDGDSETIRLEVEVTDDKEAETVKTATQKKKDKNCTRK